MLTPNDLHQIRQVMKEEIQDTVPKIVQDIVQDTVSKIVHDIVQNTVPKIVKDIVYNIVDDAKKEMKSEIKKSILREHKKTRAMFHMVIGDYDRRIIDHRKRLERIEAHLDLPRIHG